VTDTVLQIFLLGSLVIQLTYCKKVITKNLGFFEKNASIMDLPTLQGVILVYYGPTNTSGQKPSGGQSANEIR